MSSKFKRGDIVYFLASGVNTNPKASAKFAAIGVDIYEHQVIESVDGRGFCCIKSAPGVHLSELRFESAEEWAKHQRPVSAERAETLQSALGLRTAAHVAARQAALDQYKESRARQGYTGISAATFNNAFDYGFDHAIKLQNATAFTAALSRATDPVTSKAASKVVQVGQLQDVVLKFLENGPATASEIAEGTNYPLNAISPRMRPLINKNLIEVCGTKTVSGLSRTAHRSLYRLVDHAKQAAENGV